MQLAQNAILQLFATEDERLLLNKPLFSNLTGAINSMIVHDFGGLVHLLYRVDIDENLLKKILRENQAQNAGEIIATLLIERQVKKIRIRRAMTQNRSDIPEDEKW